MIELLCLLLPFGFGGLWFLVPAAVDLVRQDERVGVWWGVGLAPIVPPALLALVVPTLQEPGMERVTVTGWLWASTWLAAAGCLLAMSMGLAVARGLRPGGETERRFRTTVVAALVLVLASVGVVVAIPILEEALVLLWVVPAAWGGLFWVLLLNRRGPARLEHGRRASATWLFAAGSLFLTAVVLAVRALAVQEGVDATVVGVALAAIGGTLGLMAALRWLAGPLHRLTVGLALAANLTLLLPEVLLVTFRPLPSGAVAPAWVDVTGAAASNRRAVQRLSCVRLLPGEQTVGRCSPYGDGDLLAPPGLRMAEVTAWGDFLVDNGRYSVWIMEPDPYGPAQVVPVPGGWRVDGRVETTPEGLIRALGKLDPWEQVSIEVTDSITVQEFITICASSRSGSCRAVRLPEPGETPPPPMPLFDSMKGP